MVLGQDEAIAAAVKSDFQRSGLAHLLAVSGQNVLLLCTLVLALGALAGLPLRARLAAAIVLVAIYVPLAGAGPSIQRAGVMGIAGLVAALAGRPASRWYALGLAAAVTLALNPLAAGEPGWQLSFAAVAGLLALAPGLRDALTRRRVRVPLAEVAAITVAATAATAPLMALHFEQVSLASLPANLLAAAVVAPVMWLGMIAIALAQLAPALAGPLNLLCAPLLGYLEWIAHIAASAPLAAVPVRLGGPVGRRRVAALVAACRGAEARRLTWRRQRRRSRRIRRRGRPARLRAAGSRSARAAARRAVAARSRRAVAAVALIAARPRSPCRSRPGSWSSRSSTSARATPRCSSAAAASVLVDTGPPGGPILRRLREAGVERLDLLVLTHAQADHEGWRCRCSRPTAPRLVLDGGAGWPTAVQRGLPAALARSGGARGRRRRRAGAAHRRRCALRVLWPPPRAPAAARRRPERPRARRPRAATGSSTCCCPRTPSRTSPPALDLPRVEALKVAHHGSADPGCPRCSSATRPRVAAIEVGAATPTGIPRRDAGRAARRPQLVRTDRDGTVRLHVPAGGCAWSAGDLDRRRDASRRSSLRLGRGARPSAPPT